MYFIKNFLSHTFTIILFLGLLLFSANSLSKELITYDNLYTSLQESNLLEEALKKNNSLQKINLSEDLLEYVEIEDLVYSYISNKFLYEANFIEKDVHMNINSLNERIASGLEKYIDEKYENDLEMFIEEYNIDPNVKEEIQAYIDNGKSLDFSDNRYITYDDLDVFYDYVDKAFLDVRERTYIFELIDFINNKNIPLLSGITIGLSFILISLINFNIVTGFMYLVAPFIINSIIYFIGYFTINNITFTGKLTADIMNYIKDLSSDLMLKYALILLGIGILFLIIYFVGKKLNIKRYRKKGKATLDTFFDDYNSEEVVKKLNEDEKE